VGWIGLSVCQTRENTGRNADVRRQTECVFRSLGLQLPRVGQKVGKGLLLSLSVIFSKSVNISYKQERDCLVHFLRF